jgi:hypothetical protein
VGTVSPSWPYFAMLNSLECGGKGVLVTLASRNEERDTALDRVA